MIENESPTKNKVTNMPVLHEEYETYTKNTLVTNQDVFNEKQKTL